MKQLIRYLKGTRNTLVFVCDREQIVQKGLLGIVGRSNSDWAGDTATRQSVTGYHCNVQNVTMCNRSLKQTISLSSCEAEFYAASFLRRRIVGTRRTLQGTSLQRVSSYRGGLRLGKTHSTAQGIGRTQAHRDTMLGNTTLNTSKTSICKSSGHEKQHSRSFHETSGWIENTVACWEAWSSNE